MCAALGESRSRSIDASTAQRLHTRASRYLRLAEPRLVNPTELASNNQTRGNVLNFAIFWPENLQHETTASKPPIWKEK